MGGRACGRARHLLSKNSPGTNTSSVSGPCLTPVAATCASIRKTAYTCPADNMVAGVPGTTRESTCVSDTTLSWKLKLERGNDWTHVHARARNPRHQWLSGARPVARPQSSGGRCGRSAPSHLRRGLLRLRELVRGPGGRGSACRCCTRLARAGCERTRAELPYYPSPSVEERDCRCTHGRDVQFCCARVHLAPESRWR